MPLAKKILPNYTYEEYCQWEGKWELIDGIPFAMTPAPSPFHQMLASRLNVELANCLNTENCNCDVYLPIDLKIDEHHVVQPDVFVVCKPVEKPFLDFPPWLVAEILSPSTREKDLITKYELYGSFGIKYYVIIDPEERDFIVYSLQNGHYVKLISPFELITRDGCRITPDFGNIFS